MTPLRLLSVLMIGTIVLSGVGTASAISRDPVVGKKGMAVAQEAQAARVGQEILVKGGNAVDAAVAVAFALAVTHPSAGNIGGGGFMVIRTADGKAVTIDYREKAPGKATATMFLDDKGAAARNPDVTTKDSKGVSSHPFTNRIHLLAVGVPGTVAGLMLALEKYGSLPLATVIQPAIDLAEKGFLLSNNVADGLNRASAIFTQIPSSKKAMMRADGKPWQAGDRWIQKDLAETFKRIAKDGRDGFYKGKTAELIEKAMMANGGLIAREDLANYQAVVREPIRSTYRGYEVLSMPPPSSGGIVLAETLNLLEGYDLNKLGAGSSKTLHLMAEAMRRSFAERAQFIGDPDFVQVPVAELTSKEHAAKLRTTIDPYFASRSQDFGPKLTEPNESIETTHFSVVDQWGGAVSNTYTLEGGYGSHIVIEGAGFLTNNEMGDFNSKPGTTLATGQIGTRPNLIEPNKRMLSSMTPAIVIKDGKPYLVVGSPGGRTIINTTLQLISNVIDHGMTIQEAVDAPRIHHQWFPDVLNIETGVPNDVLDALRAKGHKINQIGLTGGPYRQGSGNSIMVDSKTGDRLGAPDPRSADSGAYGH